jgi:putative endonuclease
MQERCYFVYITTNERRTVLYTGVTNNLLNREDQHKQKINKNSFTAKYNANKVVYYEMFADIGEAIFKEKQIKGGSRQKKIDLIENMNPNWHDLINDFYI